MKNSFVLYTEYKNLISDLSVTQKGELFDAIFDYQMGKKVELDPITKMAFNFIAARLDKDNARYEKTCEARREAGSKGGLAKASNSKQKLANASKTSNSKQMLAKASKASKSKQNLANLANLADNDNDYDNDYDNDININRAREDSEIPGKKLFGQNNRVALSTRERTKLVYQYGEELANKAIDYLDNHKTQKGFMPTEAYSDFEAIKSWVINAVKNSDQPKKQNPFNNFTQNQYSAEEMKELEEKLLEN